MAAPTTSYLNNGNDKITLETTDANENLLSTFDSLIASYIYGAADIKALFYLDAIYEIEIMAADETTVVRKGFIGVVENDPNSFNFKHHKTSRFFHVQFDTTTSAEVFVKNWIAFGDGGLNTLATTIGTPVATSRAFNNVQIPMTYKSAYYVPTDVSGWEFRLPNSNGTWQGWSDGGNLGSKPQNQQYTLNAVVVFDDVTSILKQYGFQVRPYITNAEGKWYGEISNAIFVTGILTSIKEGSWSNGTPNSFYRDNAAIQGFEDPREQVLCRFYTDEGMNILFQPNGVFTYWRDANNWLTYGYSTLAGEYCVIRTGTASGSGTTIKPNTYVYEGYHATNMTVAEDQVLNNTGSNTGTLYVDGFSAFISYSGSYPAWNWGTKAPQGYYADGNIASVNSVIYVKADGTYEYVYIN